MSSKDPKLILIPSRSNRDINRQTAQTQVKRDPSSSLSQFVAAQGIRHRLTGPTLNQRKETFIPRTVEGRGNEASIRDLKTKLKDYDTYAAVVSVLGLIFAFIENEIFIDQGNQSQTSNHILRALVTITCVLSRKKFDVSVDAYILFIMFGRLYVLFRLFNHYTIWTNFRATRVCKMNGFTADSKFAIKAYLKYKPFAILSIGLGLSVLIFGLTVRIFERPVQLTTRSVNFNFVWNSFWSVIVTMATIGYGDVFAVTHLGRFVSIAACIWGVFLLSLFVVVLNNYVEMNKEESSAYDDLVREKKIHRLLTKEAALLIQTQYRAVLMKRNQADMKDRLNKRMELMATAQRFKKKRLAVTEKGKTVNEIIQDMHDHETEEAEVLLKMLAPIKTITETIEYVENYQYEMNDRMLKIYDNARRIYSLIIDTKKGLAGGINELKDVKNDYDFNGNLVGANHYFNYAAEFARLKEKKYEPTSIIPQSSFGGPDRKSKIKMDNHIEEESEDDSSSNTSSSDSSSASGTSIRVRSGTESSEKSAKKEGKEGKEKETEKKEEKDEKEESNSRTNEILEDKSDLEERETENNSSENKSGDTQSHETKREEQSEDNHPEEKPPEEKPSARPDEQNDNDDDFDPLTGFTIDVNPLAFHNLPGIIDEPPQSKSRDNKSTLLQSNRLNFDPREIRAARLDEQDEDEDSDQE